MALRPRAVITTPYPSPAATARVLDVSPKRYREIRAMITEYLERHGSTGASASSRKAQRRKRDGKHRIAPHRGGEQQAEADRSLSATLHTTRSSTSPTTAGTSDCSSPSSPACAGSGCAPEQRWRSPALHAASIASWS